MKAKEDELIPTRASLLVRLRNWEDHASWLEFFNIYWRLIYSVSRKAGLSDVESQDVVQETMISAAKHIPNFKYDPAIGSFKAWLLNMTRWRIVGQFRKRQPVADHKPVRDGNTSRTSTVANLPDPNALNLDEVWEQEWESNLLRAALDNVKRKSDPQRYQLFDCYVNKEWPAEKVAAHFGVSVDQVYQVKHRITETLRDEALRLKNEMT